MTKRRRVCLYRHAKSDWSDAALDDFDRPLNKRGRRAAAYMADYVAASPYRPDTVLCSTALRARETFAPIEQALAGDLRILRRDRLYLAMPEVLIDELRSLPSNAETAMIVAHNPGLELLALALGQWSASEDARRIHEDLAAGFPTAALAVFDFAVSQWRDLEEGCGLPIFFGRPKQLMATA